MALADIIEAIDNYLDGETAHEIEGDPILTELGRQVIEAREDIEEALIAQSLVAAVETWIEEEGRIR